MIFEKANETVNLFTTLIQIAAAALVGVMMVFFAGLPLVMGGIASGWVPLIIGLCGFVTAARKSVRLFR